MRLGRHHIGALSFQAHIPVAVRFAEAFQQGLNTEGPRVWRINRPVLLEGPSFGPGTSSGNVTSEHGCNGDALAPAEASVSDVSDGTDVISRKSST